MCYHFLLRKSYLSLKSGPSPCAFLSLALVHASAMVRFMFSSPYSYIFFIMFPSMVGLIVLRVPITSLLFQRGTFTYQDTLGTAYALLFYAMGLWAYSGVRITNAAFYSLQDTRTPVVCAFVAVVINAALSLALMGPLKQGGLALATAVAATINMFVLLTIFRRRMGRIGAKKIVISAVKTAFASAVMAAVCYFIAQSDVWILSGHTLKKAEVVFAAIGAGVATYALILYLLKSEELSFIVNTYRIKSPLAFLKKTK